MISTILGEAARELGGSILVCLVIVLVGGVVIGLPLLLAALLPVWACFLAIFVLLFAVEVVIAWWRRATAPTNRATAWDDPRDGFKLEHE